VREINPLFCNARLLPLHKKDNHPSQKIHKNVILGVLFLNHLAKPYLIVIHLSQAASFSYKGSQSQRGNRELLNSVADQGPESSRILLLSRANAESNT